MRQRGTDGEAIASDYLTKKGYRVVAKNFHSRFGEIDIIATDKRTIVFVEVKLRESILFGTPLEAITNSKIEKIKKTAFYYLTINNKASSHFRIDAIEIVKKGGDYKINHLENITM